jgi:hypothetical protein
MPGGGLAFCLISNNKDWQENIVELLEKGIQNNQLTFYVNELKSVDPNTWVWYWHVAPNCSMIICDLAHSSEHEVRMALAMCKKDLPIVFNVKPGNDEFVGLLNAIGVPWYSDDKDLMQLLEAAFG